MNIDNLNYPLSLRLRVSAAIIACALGAASTLAQVDARPKDLEGIDIVERLNQPLPLDLEFVDSSGKPVKLADYFNRDKPVIITLNYYECPMLCNLQLNGLLGRAPIQAQPNRGKLADPGTGIMALEWDLGDEYEIVTISFDPDEGTELAQGKEESYINAYRREAVSEGWHFLTGTAENSRALADAIGFNYRWNEETNEWLHAAAIFIATPKGRVSRYLYGVSYDPQTLRMALLEASEGKIGNTIDKFLLWCFQYDDHSGQYTPAVMRIMRALGFVTMVTLGTGLFILWRRDQKKQARPRPSPAGRGAGGEGDMKSASIARSPSPCPLPGGEGSERRIFSLGGHSST